MAKGKKEVREEVDDIEQFVNASRLNPDAIDYINGASEQFQSQLIRQLNQVGKTHLIRELICKSTTFRRTFIEVLEAANTASASGSLDDEFDKSCLYNTQGLLALDKADIPKEYQYEYLLARQLESPDALVLDNTKAQKFGHKAFADKDALQLALEQNDGESAMALVMRSDPKNGWVFKRSKELILNDNGPEIIGPTHYVWLDTARINPPGLSAALQDRTYIPKIERTSGRLARLTPKDKKFYDTLCSTLDITRAPRCEPVYYTENIFGRGGANLFLVMNDGTTTLRDYFREKLKEVPNINSRCCFLAFFGFYSQVKANIDDVEERMICPTATNAIKSGHLDIVTDLMPKIMPLDLYHKHRLLEAAIESNELSYIKQILGHTPKEDLRTGLLSCAKIALIENNREILDWVIDKLDKCDLVTPDRVFDFVNEEATPISDEQRNNHIQKQFINLKDNEQNLILERAVESNQLDYIKQILGHTPKEYLRPGLLSCAKIALIENNREILDWAIDKFDKCDLVTPDRIFDFINEEATPISDEQRNNHIQEQFISLKDNEQNLILERAVESNDLDYIKQILGHMPTEISLLSKLAICAKRALIENNREILDWAIDKLDKCNLDTADRIFDFINEEATPISDNKRNKFVKEMLVDLDENTARDVLDNFPEVQREPLRREANVPINFRNKLHSLLELPYLVTKKLVNKSKVDETKKQIYEHLAFFIPSLIVDYALGAAFGDENKDAAHKNLNFAFSMFPLAEAAAITASAIFECIASFSIKPIVKSIGAVPKILNCITSCIPLVASNILSVPLIITQGCLTLMSLGATLDSIWRSSKVSDREIVLSSKPIEEFIKNQDAVHYLGMLGGPNFKKATNRYWGEYLEQQAPRDRSEIARLM